jgi:hypothetical protein
MTTRPTNRIKSFTSEFGDQAKARGTQKENYYNVYPSIRNHARRWGCGVGGVVLGVSGLGG